ncbi:primase-helicase family protein [Pseudomonas sp. MM227]|uniref:primase-helicase family protein n=1 Tax=Pseudomonas sp. MM227 TaxID=3019968 RepID=UPI0022203B5F|nr:primase-helicase family protein [Pseudomonas sp. MM227]
MQQLNKNDTAVRAVHNRFVIVPSTDSRPRFRDLLNMGVAPQGNPMMLLQAYRDAGGTGDINGESLLNKLPIVFSECFCPGDYRRILKHGENRLLNIWTGPDIRPSSNTVSTRDAIPFLEFLQRLFPIQEERYYFRDWLAHAVRHPDKRIDATVLLRSEHGVGKGFLTETLLSGLLGKSSVGTVALGDVVGNFNDALVGKTLIFIDEVYKNPKSTVNTLKSIQGNRTITLRRKHIPDTTVDNFLNFIISSNDHFPLPLEQEDRRFWVPAFIKHKESKKETMSFINTTLKPWLLQQGGMQIVRDLLETVDLSEFHPWGDPPMTASKREITGFCPKERLTGFVANYIREHLVVKALDLEIQYRIDTGEVLGNRAVAGKLSELGCKAKRTTEGRFWITPTGIAANLSGSSPPSELQRAHSSTRGP